jgi:hypothetical protein
MIQDPLTAWDGPYPYDVLASVGVTPSLTHAEILDVSYALLEQRLMTAPARRAWEELRQVPRRLLADFLLYDLEPEAEIAGARTSIGEELRTPGPPPQAAEALELRPELLDELMSELRAVELEPPGPVRIIPEFADPIPRQLLDDLIHFDW